MAREDLQPVRTPQEAKARGRNGGVASGQARRRKKMLKELISVALEQTFHAGFLPTDLERRMDGHLFGELVAARLIHEAVKGNLRAMSLLLNLESEAKPRDAEVELLDA